MDFISGMLQDDCKERKSIVKNAIKDENNVFVHNCELLVVRSLD